MSRKLWNARLVITSPRYADWLKILGGDVVPLVHPKPTFAQLGPESTEIYKLDLDRFSPAQRERLFE